MVSNEDFPFQFMSFSLTGGRFAAWFNMGEGLVTLETSTAYNDGFFHSVSVLREDEKYVQLPQLQIGQENVLALFVPFFCVT